MPIFLSRQHQSHLYVWLLKDFLRLGHLGRGYSVANRLVVLALETEDDGDEEQRRESHPDEDWHIVKAVAATNVSWGNDHRDGGAALTEAPAGVPEPGRAIDQRIPGPASCAPLPSAAPDEHRSPIQDLSCEGQFMAWCGCWREKQRPEPICSLWCHLSSLPDDFLGILRWVSRGLDRESAGMLCCVPRVTLTAGKLHAPIPLKSGKACSIPYTTLCNTHLNSCHSCAKETRVRERKGTAKKERKELIDSPGRTV